MRSALRVVLVVAVLGGCATSPTRDVATPGAPVRSVFGHSVQGRDLVVNRIGPAAAQHTVLVVGVVHGDEAAGRAIALDLLDSTVPAGTQLLVVQNLNPDGVAAGTRQNAHRVDLNRNFHYDWAPIGRPGDQQYSGPSPESEPETRAVSDLIRRVRPDITVWFHQPVGIVDESGGDVAIERRFATTLGVPLRRIRPYHGTATRWQNHGWPGTTAFVVELPRQVSPDLHRRAVRACEQLL
jgi:protein MpaA